MRVRILVVLTLGAALVAAREAHAGSLSEVGGFDHRSGPLGQRTDAALAALVFETGNADLTVAGSRFDDAWSGRGLGYTAGLGVPVFSGVRMRVVGTRLVGDEGLRAWRTRAGPELGPPEGWSVALAYTGYHDGAGTSHGAIAEAATPLTRGLTGTVSASSSTTEVGPAAFQAAAGVRVSALPHLLITGEVGAARNSSGGDASPSSGGGLLGGLPLIGGGATAPTPEERKKFGATLLLGVRAFWP